MRLAGCGVHEMGNRKVRLLACIQDVDDWGISFGFFFFDYTGWR